MAKTWAVAVQAEELAGPIRKIQCVWSSEKRESCWGYFVTLHVGQESLWADTRLRLHCEGLIVHTRMRAAGQRSYSLCAGRKHYDIGHQNGLGLESSMPTVY